MDLENNTVLITGGSAGIGFALAEKFVRAGSKVIVCGRRKEVLEQAKETLPELGIYVCDVGVEKERINLFNWISENYPNLNVLINNAGIQRWKKLNTDEEWSETQKEIAINFEAPIHLANLFIPHLL
ncbi:MAG: SDR family NAD(P)-dependent oxidoreductase, partial [Candidatus Sericytochromatia bacterium]|nr:SDR family NAD(P)-dependent oxidoreductase [Candidatus Sericytochromatia bacterium]